MTPEEETAACLRGPRGKLLTGPEGARVCRALRRENWYRLMITAADPVTRRLGASIFVSAALDAVRQTANPKPVVARIDRPRRAPSKPRLTPEQIAEIRSSSERGRVLAQRYGVSDPTISRVRQGMPKPNRSHLTAAEQTAIRASTESRSALARRYAVSWTTIARLQNTADGPRA